MLARAGRCPELAEVRVGRLDLAGALTAAVGFGSLTYGMVEGADNGFGGVWWAFAVAALALVAFVVVEQRVKEPMLPFSLFRRRNFAAANAETFVVYAALGSVLVYTALYLQFLGFTPFEAGLVVIPTSVILFLLAARFGGLADRHGPRLFLTAGPLLIGVGVLLFAPMAEKDDFWTFGIPGTLIFAIGLALLVAPITATALSSAPTEFAGIASGVNSTISRLGNLLAVAVVGLVVSLVFSASVGDTTAVPLAAGETDPELRDGSVDAFRVAMLVTAGLAFVGAAIGGLRISNAEAREEGGSGGGA
jgi:hypothetical protein